MLFADCLRIKSAGCLTLFIGLFLGQACTTTAPSPNESHQIDALQTFQEKEKVVQRAGASERPYDMEKRSSFYAELRGSSEIHKKLAGLLAHGEWEAASEEAKLILKARPGDVWALKMLATSFALGRKFDHASFYAYQVLRKDPKDSDMINILGLDYYFSGEQGLASFTKAREKFTEAFEHDPSHNASGLNLGELYLAVGKYSNAKETYAKVLDRKPSITEARMGYALAALRMGSEDEAVIALKTILNQDPKNAKAMYHLALIYNDKYQDKKEAEAYLQKILAMETEDRGVPQLKRRAHFILRSMRGQDYGAEALLVNGAKSSDKSDELSKQNDGAQNELELLMVDDEETTNLD